jgi:TonB family protein
MKKIICSLLILFFCANTSRATDTLTLYYNFEWKLIKPNNGKVDYVGLAWPEKGKWHKMDYTYGPFAVLKHDGYYTDNTFSKKDGVYLEYHYNGMMSDSSFFVNGLKSGPEFTWDDDGNPASIRHWHNNLPVDTSLWFTDDGKISAIQITDSMGNGLYRSYVKGTKNSGTEGRIMQGKRTGKWIFRDADGITGAEAIYVNDSATSVTCFNEKGEPETKKECYLEKMAEFKGGVEAWRRYLERNLKYPESAVNNGVQGVVRVQFNIDKEGRVSDVHALNNPGDALVQEAERIIKESGRWEPAIQYNRKVIYRHIQSVTFSLQ